MKRIQLKEEYEFLPEGTILDVDKETKTLYKGIWSSMYGSYNYSVPKNICKRPYIKKIKLTLEQQTNYEKYSKKIVKLMKKLYGK